MTRTTERVQSHTMQSTHWGVVLPGRVDGSVWLYAVLYTCVSRPEQDFRYREKKKKLPRGAKAENRFFFSKKKVEFFEFYFFFKKKNQIRVKSNDKYVFFFTKFNQTVNFRTSLYFYRPLLVNPLFPIFGRLKKSLVLSHPPRVGARRSTLRLATHRPAVGISSAAAVRCLVFWGSNSLVLVARILCLFASIRILYDISC